jgi:hypothetical protein
MGTCIAEFSDSIRGVEGPVPNHDAWRLEPGKSSGLLPEEVVTIAVWTVRLFLVLSAIMIALVIWRQDRKNRGEG